MVRALFVLAIIIFTGSSFPQYYLSEIRSPDITVPVYGFAVNGNYLYAAGFTPEQESLFFLSSDNGVHWQQTAATFTQVDRIMSIAFPQKQIGYAGGGSGLVYKTTNAGQTWERNADSTYRFSQIFKLHFFTVDSGYFCGSAYSSSTIFRTTDGGRYWKQLPTPVNNTMYSMHWDNFKSGWAVGTSGKILHTTNAGDNWQTTTPVSGNLLCICRASATTLYAAGNGDIVKSTNNGQSFSRVTTPTMVSFSAIFFKDSLNGLVAGSNGRIFSTTNGGSSWSELPTRISESITNIIPVGNMLYWSAQFGVVARSDLNADNWQNLSRDCRTYAAVSVKNKRIYIAGDGANIQILPDQQTTWQYPVHPNNTNAFLALTTTQNSIFAGGFAQWISASTNNGLTWQTQQPSTVGYYISGISFINESSGFFSTYDGRIFQTTDKGATWSYKTSIPIASISALHMSADSFGVAVGTEQKIYITTDLGNTWQPALASPPGDKLFALHVLSRTKAYVCGEHGTVYRTDNGFQSIKLLTDTTGLSNTHFYAVAAVNDSMVWAGGTGGVIFRSVSKDKLIRFDSTGFGITGMAVYDSYSAVATAKNGYVYRVGLRHIPVTFTNTTAVLNDGRLHIHWTVSMQQNIRGYEPEWSETGINWQTLGFIPAIQNNNTPENYQYENQFAVTGSLFCRVAAVHFDGSRVYSAPMIVNGQTKKEFTIIGCYPNPANPGTTIQYQAPQPGAVQLTLFNALGEKIAEVEYNAGQAGIQEIPVATTAYPSGVYYFTLNNGGVIKTGKFCLVK